MLTIFHELIHFKMFLKSKNNNFLLDSPILLYNYNNRGHSGYFILYKCLQIDHNDVQVLFMMCENCNIDISILNFLIKGEN